MAWDFVVNGFPHVVDAIGPEETMHLLLNLLIVCNVLLQIQFSFWSSIIKEDAFKCLQIIFSHLNFVSLGPAGNTSLSFFQRELVAGISVQLLKDSCVLSFSVGFVLEIHSPKLELVEVKADITMTANNFLEAIHLNVADFKMLSLSKFLQSFKCISSANFS
jgi:hypothetical protein